MPVFINIMMRCLQILWTGLQPKNVWCPMVKKGAELFLMVRKRTFSDAIDKYFKLGNNLNQRDVIGVHRTVSGLLKLMYPHGDFDKDAIERCLKYALEGRRRVKEQLKKIGGMEFLRCPLQLYRQ